MGPAEGDESVDERAEGGRRRPVSGSGPVAWQRQACAQVRAERSRLARQLGEGVGGGFALLARSLGQLGLGQAAPATSLRFEGDALVWHRVEVDGRTVVYGIGGPEAGPPVLFLHGWGLGSRTYKRALRRLVARGCRVVAPAMPGFGGSDAMSLPTMSIPRYADWAAAFLDTVGIDEPVLAMGHSFGGGVSTALAHRHPGRVRYLVLVNAVGGATWGDNGRSLAQRPMWDWARGFSQELVTPTAVELFGAMSEDLVTNVVRNPLVLARAGMLAARADLQDELVELRERGIPVMALTSDGDDVIPSTAFETLCESVGADGRVVRGNHSWLLADPDRFDEVLENVVDVEVADHRALTASAMADRVRELLVETRIPKRVADDLVADAPPLWLMSGPPAVLAGDLALCHPKLRPGEVRATARWLAGDGDGETAGGEAASGTARVRLTVVAPDRPGLLAATAAALTDAGLPITSAAAATWPGRRRGPALAVHAIVVEPPKALDPIAFEALGTRLRAAVAAGDEPVEPAGFRPTGRAHVAVSGAHGGRALVTVTAVDQPGLLAAICGWMADRGVSIDTVQATTAGRTARDTFVVHGDVDDEFGVALADALSAARRPALLRAVR